MTHLVPDETQPSQGFLDQPTFRPDLACQRLVVNIWVMAYQCGVHHGDPPDCLTDHRARSPPVPCPEPVQPFCRVKQRGDGPLKHADLGRWVARCLAIPCDPAAGGAEPGVLAARREHTAALCAVPGLSHWTMLRVTCAPMLNPAAWLQREQDWRGLLAAIPARSVTSRG